MSMHPERIRPRRNHLHRQKATFPKGNPHMKMRDKFGIIFEDADFAELFAVRGRSAQAPWRLALFRAHMVKGGAERLLLEKMLVEFKERGSLKARGRQRTDSTRVLASVRELNRLELVGETMRATLNALLTVAPDCIREHADPEWFERYRRRIGKYRLPKGKEQRREYLARW